MATASAIHPALPAPAGMPARVRSVHPRFPGAVFFYSAPDCCYLPADGGQYVFMVHYVRRALGVFFFPVDDDA